MENIEYKQLLIKFMAMVYDTDGFYEPDERQIEKFGFTEQEIVALKELEPAFWDLYNSNS